LVWKPDTERAHILIGRLVFEGLDPATSLENTIFLCQNFGLVVEGELHWLCTITHFDGTRVTRIQTLEFVSVEQYQAHCCSRQARIYCLIQLLVCIQEGFFKCATFFKLLRQDRFNELRHFFTLVAMSVADTKQMLVTLLVEIRVQDVAVLVLFPRVAGHIANSGSKCILRNNIGLNMLRAQSLLLLLQ
jgi:hypothetical protein